MIKIRISRKCIETWPCRHMVVLNDGKTKKTLEMNGTQIEKMLRQNNETNSKRYAHFKQYYCSKKRL